jgi:ribonucleotide reductase beta subunit family protein with ferritin-like domain
MDLDEKPTRDQADSFSLTKPTTSTKQTDPLLTANDDRFVMFPIQHNDIWSMYKRQVDCFWRAEEINLAGDLNDWATF